MSSVIQHLKAFNRKERFWLVGMALGNRCFKLDDGFRELLNQKLEVNVPSGAFAAMDYHLDWIYASLFLAAHDTSAKAFSRNESLISGNQMDVDLLIAYEDAPVCHIILLEAKGETGFANRPFNSKASRLKAIFESKEARVARAVPYFAIISKREPKGLKSAEWPAWMHRQGEIPRIPLDMPVGLRKVTRCNDQGLDDSAGPYWKVD